MLQTIALQNHSSEAGSSCAQTQQRFFAIARQVRQSSQHPPRRLPSPFVLPRDTGPQAEITPERQQPLRPGARLSTDRVFAPAAE